MRGNRVVLAAVTAALATVASAPPPPSAPVVTTVNLPTRPRVTYAYAIVDPRMHRIALKRFETATEIAGVSDRVACTGLSLTAGFSRQTSRGLVPEGLLRDGAAEHAALANWRDGGVFTLDADDPRTTRIAQWRRQPRMAGIAAQGHPLLVFDGRIDHGLNNPRRQNRIAVGTLTNGHVVFIAALTSQDNAVSYREFAADALTILRPRLATLLNLDGGPSAFMLTPTTRLLPATGKVTTYFCAEHR